MAYYKNIEDNHRRDITEGESSSYVESMLPTFSFDKKTKEFSPPSHTPGLLHIKGSQINPTYLLCTSGPNVDLNHMKRNFGKYIVKINEPLKLLQDINTATTINSKMELTGKCILCPVSYTKGDIIEINPDSIEAIRLNYLQKPSSCIEDCEYRYIIKIKPCVNSQPEEFIYFDLQRELNYLEMI